MNYWLKKENVKKYEELIGAEKNIFCIKIIEQYLEKHKKILELGAGVGNDSLFLKEKYDVIASDYSDYFLEILAKKKIKNIKINIENFQFNKMIDCVYANKVFHYLNEYQINNLLNLIHDNLNENGIILFTLWSGENNIEKNADGITYYYNLDKVKSFIPNKYKIIILKYFMEFEQNDSIIILLKKI